MENLCLKDNQAGPHTGCQHSMSAVQTVGARVHRGRCTLQAALWTAAGAGSFTGSVSFGAVWGGGTARRLPADLPLPSTRATPRTSYVYVYL